MDHFNNSHHQGIKKVCFVEGSTQDGFAPVIASSSTNVATVVKEVTEQYSVPPQHPGPLTEVPFDFFQLRKKVFTPVKVEVLESLTADYPDQNIREFLLKGFTFGFRVGHCGEVSKGAEKNNKSAFEFGNKVDEAILKELNRGHTIGPFKETPLENFHCSPLGGAPKKDGSVRICLDLSSPRGSSVNDFISKDDYHCKYSSFDDAVAYVVACGRGCFMGKVDIKHAFRLCPVNEEDWKLLGYKWEGRYYFDIVLPFGLRSSPYIFNSFADMLLWIIIHFFDIPALHYLDDYFTVGLLLKECQYAMDVICQVFELVGVPLAKDKVEGPSQVITFLGIEIDSVALVARLPKDKLDALLLLLVSWLKVKKCTKKELLSLIGSLSFACKVVKPGRIFLRRLIDLSVTVKSLHHHIDVDKESRKDIIWWHRFVKEWNGISLLHGPSVSSDELKLFTDASSLGIGGYFGGKWFSVPLKKSHENIAFLELLAIVAAILTWSEFFENKEILLYTDNKAIVDIWCSGSCKHRDIMKLIRKLFFFNANLNINIIMRHVPGKYNVYADLLSRLQVEKFKMLCEESETVQSTVPESIWDF